MTSKLLVRSMTVEADGVLSIELVDPDGRELPAWEPGAHLDLKLTDQLSRQYSLSGDPGDRHRYRIGVLREVAGPARETTSGSSRPDGTSSSPAASASRRSCR